MARRPPGPPGGVFAGSLPRQIADWLGFLAECERRYGPVVRLRLPWPRKPIVLVTDPVHIERVFVTDAAMFGQPAGQRAAKPVLGEGMLLAEAETWQRLRRMCGTAFGPTSVRDHANDMAAQAEEMVAGWPHGLDRDILRDTTELTARVVARILFGPDADTYDVVRRASGSLATIFSTLDTSFHSRFLLPLGLPTPAGIRVFRATRELDAIVYGFIRERRDPGRQDPGQQRSDLLSTLLHARDTDGSAFTELELRDMAVNVLAAGFESTALTLAWALYFLARDPTQLRRVRAEVDEVVGDGPIDAGHVALLSFTENVVRETLRLHPPGWVVGREARQDYELAGYHIKRGTQIFILPYLAHHNRDHFPDPGPVPERWEDKALRWLPRYAYFPFGDGPRSCLGEHFAMMHLVISLATVIRAVGLEVHGTSPEPGRPGVHLRPTRAIRLRIHRLGRHLAIPHPPVGESVPPAVSMPTTR